MSFDPENIDFKKGNGLVPAIIQHYATGQVLMLGYMNEDAVKQTVELGQVTFYSRSKKRLWTKGETSGNYLNMVSMQKDCDSDTLLVLADPQGPTCHTGETSCFHEQEFRPFAKAADYSFLKELQDLLYQRKEELPENSYTSSMFKKGLNRIAQKVGEEGVETVIAALAESEEAFIYEASDLIFHLQLLLTEKGLRLDDLVRELERRHKK
ncbi:MAG TPA: bifunctional phosphoribosyl-AMP cyclohydrolase/phosphoribosyl-ATP diphosphatase HisIE [Balneolales bacterium]|nr:bifunctional phosphoribosyl-AMP cyclohydrolase/phosphoribosyl-ATP diphosphatase HisIE [Balneolales bacterium]